jgi:hypothetical protein
MVNEDVKKLIVGLYHLAEKIDAEWKYIAARFYDFEEAKQKAMEIEEAIDHDKYKYLGWMVCTIGDFFRYADPERMEKSIFGFVKKWIYYLCENYEKVDRDIFNQFHKELIDNGITTLPVNDKIRIK